MNFTYALFGAEYGFAPRWSRWQGWYVKTLGVIDLPSRIRARQVLAAAALGSTRRILDFGCGSGSYAYFFSRHSWASVIGFDVDADRIENCSAVSQSLRRPELRFVHDSEEAFWRRSSVGEFDLILAIEVLTYVPNLECTLANMHASLRSGGRLVGHVEMPDRTGTWDRRTLSFSTLYASLRAAGFETIEMRHSFTPTHNRIIALLDSLRRYPACVALLFPLLFAAALVLSRVEKPTSGVLFHATRGEGI